MSISTPDIQTQTQQSRRTTSGNAVQAGDNDLGSFNLRDTLSGIVVREGNFNEFLAALKHSAPQITPQ